MEIPYVVKTHEQLKMWYEVTVYNLEEQIKNLKKSLELYKMGAPELFLSKPCIEEGSSEMIFNIYSKEMEIDGIKCTAIFLQKNGKTVNCAVPLNASNDYIKIAINELLDYVNE